ncbi:MAG: hypothetical protein JXR26_08320, partial [Balneolaceae bacterium]|nr:hypothetical protein [Balneolaceae bacterium]
TNLPKLIDFRTNDGEKEIKLFIEDLLEAFEIPEEYLSADSFFKLVKWLTPYIKFTARSLERILTLFTISLDSCSREKRYNLSREILLLSILKVELPVYYDSVKGSGRLASSVNKNDNKYVVGSNLLTGIKKKRFFTEDKLGQKTTNYVIIPSLIEAAKVVDIYDLPNEPEKKSNSTKESIPTSSKKNKEN